MEHSSPDIVYFGKTNYRNQQRKFGIKLDDRRRHMYIIGKTGMGKTVLLENMMIQDVHAGHGMAVIDPHGDFVEKILDFIPPHRINDVMYINPADVDYPVAFNVLESDTPAHRILIASGLLSVFKKMWKDSWGPRLEYILRNCILSLLEYPGSTLLGIPRILTDNKYRKKIVDQLEDPVVKSFWKTEFESYANQFRTEAISPIQNKIGQFLSSSLIRNIVGQPKSTIDLRQAMDEGKIVLLNLSKGRIGEDNAALLGGMMITKLQMAAMSRVDIPENQRKDFFLYVDEFQNFATESFANILSEARKYRLNLVVAHQYIEQLDETVRAAVFGNVGTTVCFRVGAGDAEFLAKEFAPVFDETDLVNLAKYNIYLRLMIDGVASDPFSADTLPPIQGGYQNAETVIRVSRERYAESKETVEEKIKRWHGVEDAQVPASSPKPAAARPEYPTTAPPDQAAEKPEPKYTELEPVVIDTGETELSLGQMLAQSPPKGGKKRPDRARSHEETRHHDAPAPPKPNHNPAGDEFIKRLEEQLRAQKRDQHPPHEQHSKPEEASEHTRKPQHPAQPKPSAPKPLRPGETVKPE